MFRFFHPVPFLQSAYYGARWRAKQWLGIKVKPHTDVLDSGIGPAVERYTRICKTILGQMNETGVVKGAVVCEIGCGDCLAAADMMLGLGARHVHLVEFIPMVVTESHREALAPLIEDPELPNKGSVLAAGDPPRLNADLVSFHEGRMENTKLPEPVDFLYSFDVLEHVDDLEGFFAYCGEVVRPGGLMMHKFDLSGHGPFEDPMPPLDFQAMPEWMFQLAFPKFNRAAGNFADEFDAMMENHGFTIVETIPIRTADPEYLDQVWPYLRPKARERSKEIVKLLDLVIVARKKP